MHEKKGGPQRRPTKLEAAAINLEFVVGAGTFSTCKDDARGTKFLRPASARAGDMVTYAYSRYHTIVYLPTIAWFPCMRLRPCHGHFLAERVCGVINDRPRPPHPSTTDGRAKYDISFPRRITGDDDAVFAIHGHRQAWQAAAAGIDIGNNGGEYDARVGEARRPSNPIYPWCVLSYAPPCYFASS